MTVCIKIYPEQEKIISDHSTAHPAGFLVPGVPSCPEMPVMGQM